MFILIGKTLRHCCAIWVFRSCKVSMLLPRAHERLLTTGMPGRPTSKHLVLEIARREFDAGDLPSNLAAFSRELADALRNEEPQAAPMKAKTVCNAIRELWRAHQKPPKPAGSS